MNIIEGIITRFAEVFKRNPIISIVFLFVVITAAFIIGRLIFAKIDGEQNRKIALANMKELYSYHEMFESDEYQALYRFYEKCKFNADGYTHGSYDDYYGSKNESERVEKICNEYDLEYDNDFHVYDSLDELKEDADEKVVRCLENGFIEEINSLSSKDNLYLYGIEDGTVELTIDHHVDDTETASVTILLSPKGDFIHLDMTEGVHIASSDGRYAESYESIERGQTSNGVEYVRGTLLDDWENPIHCYAETKDCYVILESGTSEEDKELLNKYLEMLTIE